MIAAVLLFSEFPIFIFTWPNTPYDTFVSVAISANLLWVIKRRSIRKSVVEFKQ